MVKTLDKLTEYGVELTGYLHDASPEMSHRASRPAVIFCPGGGYKILSDREKDPPALEFFARGYNVFILMYSLKERACGLHPLKELSAAVMTVREKAAVYHIDPKCVAVAGFSAGGHLAASLGVRWNSPELRAEMDTKNGLNRPDAMILCYPVITAGPWAHRPSIEWVSGSKTPCPLWDYFSLEKNVPADAAPAFIWHTVTDDGVPVENALLFASALRQAKVPFELHLFAGGPHGLSTCNEEVGSPNPESRKWVDLSLAWLNKQFGFKD